MTILEFLRKQAAKGGHAAAKSMTKAERIERARKAGKAGALARKRKAAALKEKKGEK
jgi:hypothetical protein